MKPSNFLYHPMILLNNREMEYRFCMQNIKIDNGLFLEFGVYNGKSINIFSKLKPNNIFHGFDTFEGLPEEWDLGHKKIEAGHFFLEKMPKVEKNVLLYKGLFEDTIPEWKKKYCKNISFINIDCDLYSSTKSIFNFLGDKITSGTIILFDELIGYDGFEEHELKAFKEFIFDNNLDFECLGLNYLSGQAIIRVM